LQIMQDCMLFCLVREKIDGTQYVGGVDFLQFENVNQCMHGYHGN
jgi:hypothetical protein